ncbi:MAG: DNA repair protein RecN [Chloracidobacterium sp.]|nr:DNA repair protein RecN [Chloracidobacterium sp.]MCO5334783.1 DNA repair protein RecN [Pyrinomonadaceae bacterium]
MLSFLKISNVALIDELSIAFGEGLDLLTGETGSGKSIIVDSLDALAGGRASSDLIKQGADTAVIEGIFTADDTVLDALLVESGIDTGDEIVIRREISAAGRNRIFVNGRLVTLALLKRIGDRLVDIHGQGEQAMIYDAAAHLSILDEFAGHHDLLEKIAAAYNEWNLVSEQLASLRHDEQEKLQLVDVLKFQIDEIDRAALHTGEDEKLEAEKRRLANAEKLSVASEEAYGLLYERDDATLATLERAARRVNELAEFDPAFAEFTEGIASAQALLEELAFAARDVRSRLDFSPEHIDEIETRLAAIAHLKRKYGGTIEQVLEHRERSAERLENIGSAELREAELRKQLEVLAAVYMSAAEKLRRSRTKAARSLAGKVMDGLADVALEAAVFEVRLTSDENAFSSQGTDIAEFYFSANPGEPVRPLVKIASGGEASRLMLVIKTAAQLGADSRTVVFDEIDAGIGGRVAEAVGRKLKALSQGHQILCVTHQPQIASLADRHFVITKTAENGRTSISAAELSPKERVEEIARMLAGEAVTEAARENARSMLAGAG